MRNGVVQALTGLVAAAVIALSLWSLAAAGRGVTETAVAIGTIPARIFRPEHGAPAPVLVIAHGFAGSQQLMRSFALAAARNGYVAVTFDFAGHGRNPAPLNGSITEAQGATQTLLAELGQVADYARGLGDGRLAVLGHSMASDIVVRYGQTAPDVAAVIAVSMFSPALTATAPRNLLVIAGDWEGMLKAEALRAVGLVTAPEAAQPFTTYGDPAQGTARRAAFSPHVEHVGVLFSRESLRETIQWLDQTFGTARDGPPVTAMRGPWIMALVAGVMLLAVPLSRLLPVLVTPGTGAGLPWRRLWLPLLAPMIATPLLLRVVPTQFLPVLVGDYLAAHFAAYGLLTALCLLRTGRSLRGVPVAGFALATGAVIAYGFIALVWPVNSFVTSFLPGPERQVLVAAMLAGTLCYFLADEWMTRGGARGAYAASKLAFLISLALAVALDFERLFFLIIIVPVILLFFLVHGLFSALTYRRTGHPLVAGLANALAFAWAIGVTFPLLAG